MNERRAFELRTINDDGTFDAYVATWDTVDSYGTRFKKGAFRKTINERLKRGDIKVLWQHKIDEPIGVVIAAKEDDHGLLIQGKLDIGVPRADQARQQMGSGTINQMSFGFDIIKQQRGKDGFVDVSEVRLWETSPVTFGANPETSILNVRSLQWVNDGELHETKDDGFFSVIDGEVVQIDSLSLGLATRALQLLNQDIENTAGDGESGSSLPGTGDGLVPSPDSPSNANASDFDETFDNAELSARGYRILDALFETAMDILWSDVPDVIAASDEAFEKAHSKYIDWVSELVGRGLRAIDPKANILSTTTQQIFGERSLSEIAKESPLSESELSQLLKGNILPLSARDRLAEFSKPISDAHADVRAEMVSQLFDEIRAKGFSKPQWVRLRALLSRDVDAAEPESIDNTAVMQSLRALNEIVTQ